MIDAMSLKLGMERCTNCGHRWIDYEGARGRCYLCGSTLISECVSLREIRETIQTLRKDDRKYLDKHAKRTVILKQRYREIAELSLQRAYEVYSKVKELYTGGNLSDKVIDQLIVAFRLFSDLGIHKSASITAYMTAMGYAQRGIDKEIRSLEDLNDLVAARQWFMRLGSKDWEAAINLFIGERAMATVSGDSNLLQLMMQVSIWHLYKAREYYFQQRNTPMLERIQFDIERTTQLLTSYAQGVSQIEAAKIAAQSTVQHGEHVRRGLEALGTSVHAGLSVLGEQIERYGGSLSRAIQASSLTLSTNITNAMYTLTASSKLRGRSLDRRMSEVGQLIATSARNVPDGFFQPIRELGARFAAGALGSPGTPDITSEPSVIKLAEEVIPEVKKSEEGLHQVEEPVIKLTGTLLDTLVSKGLSKVLEQIETTEPSKKDQ